MSDLSFDEQTYAILVQVLIAFGEGASPCVLSSEVILRATVDYRQKASEEGTGWDEHAPAVRGWARAIGALAAHHALHEDRAIVLVGDYLRATEAAARHSAALLGACRWSAVASSAV